MITKQNQYLNNAGWATFSQLQVKTCHPERSAAKGWNPERADGREVEVPTICPLALSSQEVLPMLSRENALDAAFVLQTSSGSFGAPSLAFARSCLLKMIAPYQPSPTYP